MTWGILLVGFGLGLGFAWVLGFRTAYNRHRDYPEAYHGLWPRAETWREYFLSKRVCMFCWPRRRHPGMESLKAMGGKG